MTLRELRESCDVTQVEMGERMGMNQSQISGLERRKERENQLPTIQRFIEALGGELEIVANVRGRRIRLRGV